MPKKVAIIDKFKSGVNNIQDPRDLPEEAIVDGLNVMTDIEGKVRQMGRDISHPLTNVFNTLSINTPGYGFFVLKSDNRITNNINEIAGNIDVESSILVYQAENEIGFYDIQNNDALIKLGSLNTVVQPAYYYSTVDGALRVCDSNYSNITEAEGVLSFDESNIITKYFKFMNKTWFYSTDVEVEHKGWINNESDGLDSFIYPPTILSTMDAMSAVDPSAENSHNLVHHNATSIETDFSDTIRGYMNPGNIGLEITESGSAEGDSDWLESDYNFGISFTYEGGQESPVTNYNSAFINEFSNNGYYISLQIQVCVGGSDADAFDPRITGCNVYLTGDSGGLYEDPYFLAEFYWGRSEINGPKLTTSDGAFTETFSVYASTGVIYNTTPIKIHKTPVITYAMRNGFRTDSESIALNYKTAVIANRRCYAGNIRRYEFDVNTLADQDLNGGQNLGWKQPAIQKHTPFINNDLMIVSPVDKYDIFPDDNTLDIGSNDGDHIILLIEYADRLLQFKQNKLFIINISEDLEFVESEHDFMGIQYPYQATKTADGVAWINENGCYLYNGEEVVNLIKDKIGNNGELNSESLEKFPSWSAIVGRTGMIGYIPKNRQIVIFEDPTGTSIFGNVLVYDIDNEAWTRGCDRVIGNAKSNIVNKYDNSLIYASPISTLAEQFILSVYKQSSPSQNETWSVLNLNSTEMQADPQGSRLLIGTTAIMNDTWYPTGISNQPEGVTLGESIAIEINEYNTPGISAYLSGDDVIINMPGSEINTDLSGKALSWSTESNAGGSMGPPVSDGTFTIGPLVSDASDKYFTYVDGSDYSDGWTDSNGVTDYSYDFGIPSPFDHWLEIGWSSGEKQFSPALFRFIARETTNMSLTGFNQVVDDEPRIIIKNSESASPYVWADSSTATELVVDLYSKSLFDNLGDFETNSDYLPSGNITSHGAHGYEWADYSISEGLEHDQINGYSNPLSMVAYYQSAVKEDGSGEATMVDNGSILREYPSTASNWYDRLSTITVPSAIFCDMGGNSYKKKILIPGDYLDSFIVGDSYVIGNTGKASNNGTYKIDNCMRMVFNDINGVVQDPMYQYITILYYTEADNSHFANVINWTSFEDITYVNTSTATGAIGSHSIGRTATKQELLLIPARLDSRTEAIYHLSFLGQDNNSYYLNQHLIPEDSEYNIQTNFDANLKRKYRDRPGDTPWWDTHSFNIPGARRLFCASGVGVTTTGDLNASNTTPFSVTLGTGVTLEQIAEAVDVGDLLMARSGTNYEIMNVTGITGTTITVVRLFESQSSTGSAVNFGAVSIDWYKINVLKRINNTQFQLKGGDYTSLFVKGLAFHIDLPHLHEDHAGFATWSTASDSDDHSDPLYYHICRNSSFTASTGTTVDIEDDITYADKVLNGISGRYYLKFPDNDASLWMDNIAGDEPGNESISSETFDEEEGIYEPDAGTGTGSEAGTGMGTNNRLIECRAQHIIANSPDFYNDINASLYITNGIEFRQFNNSMEDTKSSNAITDSFPAYVLTRDLVLDDDLYSNKVLYEVSVTYRYSGSIAVEAIVNGTTYHTLSQSNLMLNSSTPIHAGQKSISAGPVTQSTTAGQTNIEWTTTRFNFAEGFGEGFNYIKNAKTVQFKVIALSGGYGFEVNDISVVYRPLDIGR